MRTLTWFWSSRTYFIELFLRVSSPAIIGTSTDTVNINKVRNVRLHNLEGQDGLTS
ncbi:MAG: hypothetical protein IKW83_09900 [Muribaculaceae bacterium]|nr:hypothetical protein [Muribaculaceae bacterium]